MHWLHSLRYSQVSWDYLSVESSWEVKTSIIWWGNHSSEEWRENQVLIEWSQEAYRRYAVISREEQKRNLIDLQLCERTYHGKRAKPQKVDKWESQQGRIRMLE
jgi:hypothetical protein